MPSPREDDLDDHGALDSEYGDETEFTTTTTINETTTTVNTNNSKTDGKKSSKQKQKPRVKRVLDLNVSSGYCLHWNVKDAIREIIQNCFDAIVKSFKIQLEKLQFKYTRMGSWSQQTHRGTWTAKLNGVEVGSIVHDLKKSVIKITNQNAAIPEEKLRYGDGDKSLDSNLIGNFGDGLVTSALRLTVLGHKIEYRTGYQIWKLFLARTNGYSRKNLFVRTADRERNPSSTMAIVENVAPMNFDICSFLKLCPYSKSIEMSKCLSGFLVEYPTRVFEVVGHPKPEKPTKRLFIKGFFVMEHDWLHMSINLLRLDTNRDRQFVVEDETLIREVAHVWAHILTIECPQIFNEDCKYTNVFIDIVNQNPASIEARCLSYMLPNCANALLGHIRDTVAYDAQPYIEGNNEERREIENLGRTPYPCNKALFKLLSSSRDFETLENAQRDLFVNAPSAVPAMSNGPIARLAAHFCSKFSPEYLLHFKCVGRDILIHEKGIYIGSTLLCSEMESRKAVSILYRIEKEVLKKVDYDERDKMSLKARSYYSSKEFFQATNPDTWKDYERLRALEAEIESNKKSQVNAIPVTGKKATNPDNTQHVDDYNIIDNSDMKEPNDNGKDASRLSDEQPAFMGQGNDPGAAPTADMEPSIRNNGNKDTQQIGNVNQNRDGVSGFPKRQSHPSTSPHAISVRLNKHSPAIKNTSSVAPGLDHRDRGEKLPENSHEIGNAEPPAPLKANKLEATRSYGRENSRSKCKTAGPNDESQERGSAKMRSNFHQGEDEEVGENTHSADESDENSDGDDKSEGNASYEVIDILRREGKLRFIFKCMAMHETKIHQWAACAADEALKTMFVFRDRTEYIEAHRALQWQGTNSRAFFIAFYENDENKRSQKRRRLGKLFSNWDSLASHEFGIPSKCAELPIIADMNENELVGNNGKKGIDLLKLVIGDFAVDLCMPAVHLENHKYRSLPVEWIDEELVQNKPKSFFRIESSKSMAVIREEGGSEAFRLFVSGGP